MADGPRSTLRAVLLTAAVALPAGWWLAGATRTEEAPRPAAEIPAAGGAVRDVYSAGFRDDPYVLAEQVKVVEALERECRATGARCAEARAARRYLEQIAK